MVVVEGHPSHTRCGARVHHGRVCHHVDQVGHAGVEGALEGGADVGGAGDQLAGTAEGADHLVVAGLWGQVRGHVVAVEELHGVLFQPPDAVVADDHHHR